MDSNRWQKIEEVFNAAMALPIEERNTYLDSICNGDPDLRSEVSSLIAEVNQGDDFLSQPAFTLGARVIMQGSFEELAGQTLASYKILRELGHGGMGHVFLAEEQRLQRLVALKLLPRSFTSAEGALRFQQEARAASAISHPNVAHIYEFGQVDDRYYLAMEFVEGQTLRTLLKDGALNFQFASNIALQVAEALRAAHEAGVIHRDVKPENVMLRRDGYVKVLDFGLAKIAAFAQPTRDQQTPQKASFDTTPGLIMGTTIYMSPEQARGEPVDARTDVWSWGVLFYEMLVGEPPFSGRTTSDVMAEILKSEPEHLNPASILLPFHLRSILARALAKDPSQRYPNMGAAIQDLGASGSQVNSRLSLAEQSFSTVRATIATEGHAARRGNRWTAWHKFALALLVIGAVAAVAVGLRYRNRLIAPASTPMEITKLTTDGRILDAALSTDGRLLAYVPISSGHQSLWIQDLQTGKQWQLLPPDTALYWGMRFTPNGQSLLYLATQPSSTVPILYRVAVQGGPSTKLVVNVDGPPAVSPDGMQIAFMRTYPAQHRDVLIIANVDGSAEREIAVRNHPDKFSSSGPAWSPDSKLIAVGAGRNSEAECAVLGVPTNNGPVVELTPWQWAAIGGVAWKNDGGTLILSARPLHQKTLQLWRLSYPEGQLKQITTDNNEYEEVTLAQTSSMLVTTNTYETSDIWAVTKTGATRRVTNMGHDGADGLAISPSGRVVFTEGSYEESTLWSMKPDGTDRRKLTDNTGFLPFAAHAGKFITYVSTERGTHHVWLMDENGENNHQLTFGGGENYPTLTPDNLWVIYTSLANQRGTLWRISTNGGEPVQLTYQGISVRPVVSPDGSMIACTYRLDETDKWKIAVLPITGGPPLRTFAVPYPYLQIIRWSPDSRAFTYLDKRNGVHNLWQQPLDGSPPTQITNFSEDQILHYDHALSADEYILARGGRRRDIALIKNFD